MKNAKKKKINSKKKISSRARRVRKTRPAQQKRPQKIKRAARKTVTKARARTIKNEKIKKSKNKKTSTVKSISIRKKKTQKRRTTKTRKIKTDRRKSRTLNRTYTTLVNGRKRKYGSKFYKFTLKESEFIDISSLGVDDPDYIYDALIIYLKNVIKKIKYPFFGSIYLEYFDGLEFTHISTTTKKYDKPENLESDFYQLCEMVFDTLKEYQLFIPTVFVTGFMIRQLDKRGARVFRLDS